MFKCEQYLCIPYIIHIEPVSVFASGGYNWDIEEKWQAKASQHDLIVLLLTLGVVEDK